MEIQNQIVYNVIERILIIFLIRGCENGICVKDETKKSSRIYREFADSVNRR